MHRSFLGVEPTLLRARLHAFGLFSTNKEEVGYLVYRGVHMRRYARILIPAPQQQWSSTHNRLCRSGTRGHPMLGAEQGGV